MLPDVLNTLYRWILGIAFLGVAFWCATTGYENLNFFLLLLAVPLFVAGISCLWKTIFYAATRPFTAMIDAVFFPGGKLSKPVLNLKLPRYYVNESRFDEALEEYQRIIKHYPDEAEAYDGAISLYVEIFEEPDEARKLYDRAKRRHLVLDDSSRQLVQANQR